MSGQASGAAPRGGASADAAANAGAADRTEGAGPETPWERATLALRLLAMDPAGLGGLWLRARSGPVRERLLGAVDGLPLPRRKLHPGIADDQLFGAVDLSATLGAGRMVWSEGLLARPAALILPMAERCPPGLAARLAGALDGDTGHCLIALDEGAGPEEALPAPLADRLALHVDLEGVPLHQTVPLTPRSLPVPNPARPPVAVPETALADLVAVAQRLGIGSLRAPLQALRAARAHALMEGRDAIGPADLAVAVALVLGPRATQMPAGEEEAPDDVADDAPPDDMADSPPEEREEQDGDAGEEEERPGEAPPQEILLEAALATLPRDLLERLAAASAPRGAAGTSGAGAGKSGNRRGRPLPSRPGRPGGTARVDLVATLRAAAPWQKLRRADGAQRLHVRPGDVRTRRYKEQSDRLLIFAVDASGSAAMTRLAEAKGAVELLLGEAYARRDHVALVAFRGAGAEVLLPPTRSLVQTKRRLAGLPGGGGTPLPAGLAAALDLARAARGKGMTPTLALLTDGRANIALDGTPNRAQAGEDATRLARAVRAAGIPALVIDTAPRRQPALEALAREMEAGYLPMPRADAGRLSAAVAGALPGAPAPA